jgi:predicted ATPase
VSKQRNLQVIVESHSEHLLQRFQRRVAEESFSVDDLKLYFCDIQQGESKLIDLKLNEFGEIENYPDNFFGDEMAEIAATRRASLKHKIRKEQQNG